MSMHICKKDEKNPYFSTRQNPALRQGSVGICSIFKFKEKIMKDVSLHFGSIS